MTLLLGAFLLAHGAIHASFLSQRPPATNGGPAWPFSLDRSWLLSPTGVDRGAMRILGLALVALTAAGFALAAVVAVGIGPESLWVPSIVVGSIASIALLAVFFHPWLVLGVVIDVVLLWAVLVAEWMPA